LAGQVAGLLESGGLDADSIGVVHRSIWWVQAVAALLFIAAIPYCRLMHIVAGTLIIAVRDYAQFGGRYEVMHRSQLLGELVGEGRLRLDKTMEQRVAYHDPCYLARVIGIIEPPRQLIDAGLDPSVAARVELPRPGRSTACCGGGGGRMWFDDAPADRIGADRIEEALGASPDTIAVSCPFCLTMMKDGVAAQTPASR